MGYLVSDELVALHADGTLAWTKPLQGYDGGIPTVGHDGTIYVGNGSHVYAFWPDGSTRWDVDLVDPTQMGLVSIGPDDTLYATGLLYAGAALYHLSPSDGSTLWQFAVPGTGGEGRTVLDAVGSVFTTIGGFVYALRCDGSQLWAFTKGGCRDLAIGSDGLVYAACADRVYALGP